MGIPLYGQNKDGDNIELLANAVHGSKVHDYGSLADEADEATTVSVDGAALGDFALASLSIDNEDVIMSASVSAANVVTVNAKNISGGTKDLGSATIRVLVIKKPS
jgi:hypothetical protein|tara:strand:- start:2613 stop:2930 length:318 start_codon:yes stop_codon:yes gene_type:complete